MPTASQGDTCARGLGSRVPELNVCICVRDHVHLQVLSHRHNRAVFTGMETGTHMIFVLTWQGFPILLPLVHFFLSVVQPWRPPWALHGICLAARRVCMPAGLYFIHQQPCLEQRLIFWLPFGWPSLSFNSCMLWCPSVHQVPGKQQQDRKPPRMYLPFPHEFRHYKEVHEEQLMKNSALVGQYVLCVKQWASRSFWGWQLWLVWVNSHAVNPALAHINNERSCDPLEKLYVLWLVALWKFVCLYRSCVSVQQFGCAL